MTPGLTRVAQLLLAVGLLLASLVAAGAARAQSLSVGNANLGNVASSASSTTDFTFSPSGSVSVSGIGGRTKTSTGSVRGTLTITCTGGPSNDCRTKDLWVQVQTTGTPTGRAGALSNFTMALGSGTGNATIVEGPTQVSSTVTRMRISAIGKDKTAIVYIGATLPIDGDSGGGSVGSAVSPFLLATADANGANIATAGGSATANVFRALSVLKHTDLNFGRIVRPLSGPGSVFLNSVNGARTATGATWLSTPIPTRARYTVTGEGGQALSITVPPSFTMNGPGGATLSVDLNHNVGASPAISSSLGSSGTYQFHVGGTISVPSTTASGAYTGTFVVTVEYN